MKKTRKVVLISILIAICVILSVVDKLISNLAFPFLPTAKIGLANIIILYALYKFKFQDVLIMVVLKSVLTGLILGSVMTFIISISASLTSFFAMFLFKKLLTDKVSSVGISLIGGFTHICVQLLVTGVIYRLGDAVLYYGGLLVLVSLITSVIIGLIDNKLIKVYDMK